MNQPQYKIFGQKRREKKKKLGELKRYLKTFWYYHQLDKDMCSFYNCQDDRFPMNDKEAQKRYNKAEQEIKLLELKLSEPYDN